MKKFKFKKNHGNEEQKIGNFHKITFYLSTVTFTIIIALTAYWAKSQLHINIFKNFSFSDHFPLTYFSPNRVLHNPEPGLLLEDNFNSFSLFGNWNDLWMRERGKVIKYIADIGINDTRALAIKSESSKSWSCSHNKMIQVKKGDVFTFKASVKLLGKSPSAYVGVSSFDNTKKVILWNQVSEEIKMTDVWIHTYKEFTINENIEYIQFRLSGTGEGEFHFDDVLLMKNK